MRSEVEFCVRAFGGRFETPGVAKFAPVDRSHVKEICGAVLGYFGVG